MASTSASVRPPFRTTLSQGSAWHGMWRTGERKQIVQSPDCSLSETGPVIRLQLVMNPSSGPQHLLCVASHHYLRDLAWTEHPNISACHEDSEMALLCFICVLIRSVSCFQV